MLELPQRLGLDLPDTLARHRKLLADLLQRVVAVHAEAEAYALGLKVKLVMPTASSQLAEEERNVFRSANSPFFFVEAIMARRHDRR